MLVVVRTVDRLSVAKETPVLQAVKRMDWLWQQCSVFALYTLPERFVLRRFAIVREMALGFLMA